MNRYRLLFTGILSLVAIFAPAESTAQIPVGNVEELYAAVDNAANAGMTLILSPGVYTLSPTTPSGTTRANRGRLDLQENMSLIGVEGDRDAVVIDANNLPVASLTVATRRVAAVRMGRGTTSVQWMTIRNARNGTANIDTTLVWPGTAYVTVAHISSTGSQRGLDVINSLDASSGETIEADVVDNDFFNNGAGPPPNQGVRFTNFRVNGSIINARIVGNRCWGAGAPTAGILIANNNASNSVINAYSSGNRAFDNLAGTILLGGNGQANGNSIYFAAHGDQYVNNIGTLASPFYGGLAVIGGENTTIRNGVNNNTVDVDLWGCRMGSNNVYDLYAVGARSTPVALGTPGQNNHVTIRIQGEGNTRSLGRWQPVEFFADVLPFDPATTNSVTVFR